MADQEKVVETQEQKQTQVVEVKSSRVMESNFALGIFGTSDNFLLATQMAKALSASTVVPKEYQGNYANSLVAIEMSQRLKTSPLMVMQNLNVIQGRPSWSAQFLIAMVNNSGLYDFELQYEEVADKNGKPFSCTCWTERKGRKVNGIVVDMEMAKAEGWVDKNGSKWKTMPQVMLRYRAAAFFERMNCPEVGLGIYTQDEIIDGDFKEYPLENIEQIVKKEIASHANTVDFEEITEPAVEGSKEVVVETVVNKKAPY